MSTEGYLGPELRIQFPPLDYTNKDQPVCAGGNLSPGILLSAYEQGLFPWYNPGDPILWWSPDPRFVLFPKNIHVGKRLIRYIRVGNFRITINSNFPMVMESCKNTRLDHTWIQDEMVSAYCTLHSLGKAHSIEVWQEDRFVGGLYGILTRRVFSGESMVSLVPNASKIALIALTQICNTIGIEVIDCQMKTPYLESMGGEFISRKDYIKALSRVVETELPFPSGDWMLEI